MTEAQNFVEKEMEKILEIPEPTSKEPEIQPTYTPPVRTFSPETKSQPAKDVFDFPTPSSLEKEPTVQIIEKIIYKKQRIHGFFRTLTIIALLAIGFLMLGESTGTIVLSVNSFKLHQIFPIFIIFSSIIIRSYKGIFGKVFGLILFMTVFGGIFTMGIYTSLNPSSKRTSGKNIEYTRTKASKTGVNNMYISTLIENSIIEGNTDTGSDTIQGTRQSERNLLVMSGEDTEGNYIKLNEDNNRNILQNYLSKINLIFPQKTTVDLLYIKNLFGIHTINLDTFQRKTFKFNAGIDDLTINIGNVLSGNTIDIQGAAANVNLNIPKDVAVNMYYKHLAGMLKTPEFDVLSGHYFQSQNTSGAKATLNIYINLGLGNTTINRVDAK